MNENSLKIHWENISNIEWKLDNNCSGLSKRQCRLWRRAAVKDILFECYIVWNSQCLKKLSEQWDLELFSLGPSLLSLRYKRSALSQAMCGSLALAAWAGTFKSRNNRLLPGTRASNCWFICRLLSWESPRCGIQPTKWRKWTSSSVRESDSLCGFFKKKNC